MLDKIKELLRSFQWCSPSHSDTDLSLISWSSEATGLKRNDCFIPGMCANLHREKRTDYFITWYAKNCFFDRFFNKGTTLFEHPWKSVVLVPFPFNRYLYLIFVDIHSLQHKIFKSNKRKSWKSICRLMFETEYRPAKLLTQYRRPFRSREFESFTRSCGYIMCGGNSHKFLLEQVRSFDQVYEIIEKVKYIVTNSSTVGYDLTLLQYFVTRENPKEIDSELPSASGNKSPETVVDEINNSEKNELQFDGCIRPNAQYRQETNAVCDVKEIPLDIRCAVEDDLTNFSNIAKMVVTGLRPFQELNSGFQSVDLLCIDFDHKVQTVGRMQEYTTPVSGDECSFRICNRQFSGFSIAREERKKVTFKFSPRRKEAERGGTWAKHVTWESVVMKGIVSHGRHMYVFMDVDTCYPHVVAAENDAIKVNLESFVTSCKTFFQTYTKPKEIHVIDKKPFDSGDFKNFILAEGISYFTNSPILECLKKPCSFFSVVLRIVSSRGHHDSKLKLLQDFVKNELIKEGKRVNNDGNWKKVLGAKMTTPNGSFFLFIDIENNFVDASPKIPVKCFSTQEVILACFEEFIERGIPEELHTCGGPVFTANEFKLLVDYCNITHCSSCPLLNRRSKFYKTFLKISCCFERTSDVCSGLELWSSLRKRILASELRQRNKIRPHHPNEENGRDGSSFNFIQTPQKKKTSETKRMNQKRRLAKVVKMLIEKNEGNHFRAEQLLPSIGTRSKRSTIRNVTSLSSGKIKNVRKLNSDMTKSNQVNPSSKQSPGEIKVSNQPTITKSAKNENRKKKKNIIRQKPKKELSKRKMGTKSFPITKDGDYGKDVADQRQ